MRSIPGKIEAITLITRDKRVRIGGASTTRREPGKGRRTANVALFWLRHGPERLQAGGGGQPAAFVFVAPKDGQALLIALPGPRPATIAGWSAIRAGLLPLPEQHWAWGLANQ